MSQSLWPEPCLCRSSASSQALLSSHRTHSSLQFQVSEHTLQATCPSLFWQFLSCAPVPRTSVWQVAPVGCGELNQILGWGCFWEPQNSGWEPLKASQHACAALLGLPPQPFGNMSLRGVEVAGGARVVGRGWSGGGTWGQ